MVYDEGFDIIIGDQSYFAFNKYSKDESPSRKSKSKWNSHCFATLVGWYHIGDKWGCFTATKKGESNPYKVTNGEGSDKQIVLDPNAKGKPTNEIMFVVEKIDIEKEPSNNFINFMETNSKSLSESTNLLKMKLRSKSKTRFQLRLTSSFKDHAKVVERINELDLGWKAFNYDRLADLTISQINKLSGRVSSRILNTNKNKNEINSLRKNKKVKTRCYYVNHQAPLTH